MIIMHSIIIIANIFVATLIYNCSYVAICINNTYHIAAYLYQSHYQNTVNCNQLYSPLVCFPIHKLSLPNYVNKYVDIRIRMIVSYMK